jgi:hypothetical protein
LLTLERQVDRYEWDGALIFIASPTGRSMRTIFHSLIHKSEKEREREKELEDGLDALKFSIALRVHLTIPTCWGQLKSMEWNTMCWDGSMSCLVVSSLWRYK